MEICSGETMKDFVNIGVNIKIVVVLLRAGEGLDLEWHMATEDGQYC